MKTALKTTAFAALLLTPLAVGPAAAQPAPYNEVGATWGHWHVISKDVEANKKLFIGMGGKLYMPGGQPLMMFPHLYINLTLGNEKGDGGTQGSVVNHVGFIVNNVQERVAQWKAAGVTVLPGNNNRLDQAYVETPDGVRMEILEDKTSRCRSGMSTCICPCWNPRFRRRKRGTPRRSAARQPPATTRRSSTCRARRSALPKPTRRRLRPGNACSTTLAST